VKAYQSNEVKKRVADILDMVQLGASLLVVSLHMLSGGQRQRVALADLSETA